MTASDNSAKTWLPNSLSRLAEKRAHEAIQLTGKALPCSVQAVLFSGIVTVKFEMQGGPLLQPVTMPKAATEWVRYPTQVGDKGVAISADFYLGGVSGLGGGVADFTQRGNLSTLIFLPIGNTAWSTVDLNSVVLYGPNGVTMRDQANTTSIVLNPGTITIRAGGKTYTFGSAGFTIDGILWETHEHTGVTAGSAKTGGPTSP